MALEELALAKEEIEALEEDKNQQTIQCDAERQQLKDDLMAINYQDLILSRKKSPLWKI